jgi:hypothetical protein
VFQRPNTAMLWVAYSVNGRRIRESAGTSVREEALRFLKKRLGEVSVGRVVTPDVQRVTLTSGCSGRGP